MATVHYRNAKVYAAGFDLGGDFNSLALALASEMLDRTTFGASTRTNKGGLTTMAVSGSGFWNADAGAVDRIAFDLVGVDDTVVTVFPDGITEGTAGGRSAKGVVERYDLAGEVSGLLGFTFAAMGRGIEA